MRYQITAALAKQEVEDITLRDQILNLAATHFFCTDKTQFEALYSAEAKDIRVANGNIIKFARRGTIRLLVCYSGSQSSREILLIEVIYTPILEINFLSI